MLKTSMIAMLLVGNIFHAGAASSSGSDRHFSLQQLDRIEKSLISAMESNRPNLQASAAYTLLKLKALVPGYSFSESIIPLMRIVKDESHEVGARVAAGLALHTLRSERGDFAISREAKFTEVRLLNHLYSWLAYARFQERKKASASD